VQVVAALLALPLQQVGGRPASGRAGLG